MSRRRSSARRCKGRRDDVVLATKFVAPMSEDSNHRGSSRRWIIREVRGQPAPARRRLTSTSTKRIGPTRRPTSTRRCGALSDLVHQGKVRVIGSSTYPAEQIVEAQWVAERRGPRAVPVRAAAVLHLRPRASRPRVLPTCQKYGMGVIPWSPLAGGWLTGRYRKDAPPPEGGRARRTPERFDYERAENQRKLELVEALATLADDAGLSLTHLALAFVLEHPAVTSAIIGPRTMEQLDGRAGRRRRAPCRRRARPHRRDRASRHERQRRRHRVGARVAPTLAAATAPTTRTLSLALRAPGPPTRGPGSAATRGRGR